MRLKALTQRTQGKSAEDAREKRRTRRVSPMPPWPRICLRRSGGLRPAYWRRARGKTPAAGKSRPLSGRHFPARPAPTGCSAKRCAGASQADAQLGRRKEISSAPFAFFPCVLCVKAFTSPVSPASQSSVSYPLSEWQSEARRHLKKTYEWRINPFS
jgi:hypothetical protein